MQKTDNIKNKKAKNIIWYILIGVFLLAFFSCLFLVCWALNNFNVSFQAILYTLSNPLRGADSNIINDAIFYCGIRLFVVLLIYIILVLIREKLKKDSTDNKKINIKKIIYRIVCLVMGVFSLLSFTMSLIFADMRFGVVNYLKAINSQTKIYEEYYVNPSNVEFVLSESGKKNLIHIYMESMETTYTSKQNGGSQNKCYIPNLVNLAKNNISFSNNDNIGGFVNTNGTTWTMGALLALTSGIPYAFPIEGNSMYKMKYFAKKLVNLGDILQNYDYNQYFLCGSDAEFGGRKSYFQQHGNYEILDLDYARKNGYVEEDYHNGWWGYEDFYLYEIAKTELLKISKEDKPFNMAMLTVDTHFSEGYICDLCNNKYPTITENVISCADAQIYNFIEWLKQQDFYEDTIIVISGDHARMDTHLVKNAKVRPIYNCFINCGEFNNLNTKNRVFTPMDMFPTILSAIGFSWEGDRLALGTNLFSNRQTLAEEIGFNKLNEEFLKYSEYYIENFG